MNGSRPPWAVARDVGAAEAHDERVELREPDGDRSVELAPEEAIDLLLEDLPSAGWRWEVSADGPLRVEQAVAVPEPEPGHGAPATRRWRVSARGPGRATVRGTRRRVGDDGGADGVDRRFTLHVTVRGARP